MCGDAPCLVRLKKKKKDPSFYLHKTTWELGQWGWTGQERASWAGSWQQSLHLEDLIEGSWDSGAQKSWGLQWCRLPFVSLVSPQEVLKYCPERPQGTQFQLLPTPSTTPWSSSPRRARVHVTPSTPVTATPAPSRRGATAWRAPKRFISVVSIVVFSV